MSKLYPLLQISLCTFGYLCATGSRAIAQVTSDNTVNTQVNQNGNVAEITGGETRGSNLFHSFQDFSVPTGNEAFFNNADSIANIFSRVTGGNISDIDGAIRANGSASLFLINPAGIIFGENARLDIGGSFYGSTADSILFEDGEFSAVDNLQQPLLTINAPIGLSFRDEPGDIVNRSFFQNSAEDFVGLEVASGQTLALVGGDINFESGEATASGGNIYLGGLAEAGIIEFNEDGSLGFPQDVTLANITLTNAADVDVSGTGGGSITVNAQNLTLEAGEFGSSFIRGGISSESTALEAQAGDVAINVADNITLNESFIANFVGSEGIGDSGNIIINTDSLELVNGGEINANTFGRGNAGNIFIEANDSITLDNSSLILSLVRNGAIGDAGDIDIQAKSLSLIDGSQVSSSLFRQEDNSPIPGGQGNGGNIKITTTDFVNISGVSADSFSSGLLTITEQGANGQAGDITVNTNIFRLSSSGNINSATRNSSNGGDITINANTFEATSGGQLRTTTRSDGNAGNK